jgi:putative SOS response-associated peptidase YedK
MNARIEEVAGKRNYMKHWRAGQLCLVPCEHFYEPNWETGKHIRYKIGMADGSPFAVAGMWRSWEEPDGTVTESFTQLTMNADDHPLMKRFHKPGDEKRSLIIVPESDWEDWLMCRDPERARTFEQPFPAELMAAEPAPLPPRKRKEEKALEDTPSLF